MTLSSPGRGAGGRLSGQRRLDPEHRAAKLRWLSGGAVPTLLE
jgi:hypothetical protein